MLNIKDLNKKPNVKQYVPDKDEQEIQTFVSRRIEEMQNYRRSLGIEKIWREADEEYIPHELDFGNPRKRFETDQETGIRSRLVPIGDDTDNWRSTNSAPILITKIQTAFSLIIDSDPEGMLTALQRKYVERTQLAYSLWKRNWSITDSKEILKLVVFDMLKYGWGVERTFPKEISYDKDILIEYDPENPENNKYENKHIVWFNDVARQRLSPYRTWIDEQTKPYDEFSMNDCYYELDFDYDALKREFGKYKAFECINPDSKVINNEMLRPGQVNENEEKKDRKDIVTVGFYENREKDLYVIWIPKDKIVLHVCPLPNDDGLLSLSHTPWILRSADNPYGVSIWELIRQDKQSFDKFMNMTDDQLVLSIMKFGYHTGTSAVLGDGTMKIKPGQSTQITNGKFEWMEIPGPGQEAWKGLEYKQSRIDEASGITPTMQGELTGKTLGEIQLAKEAALKKLKTPLGNIAWIIEQDAYKTLSWMKQVYSTPEIKEFANESELKAYEKETGQTHNELFANLNKDGIPEGNITASYLPELSLHLEDKDGKLFESSESRFFKMGKDIQGEQLNWKGIFKVIPRSIVDSSETIMKQSKMEMANILIPLLQQDPMLVKPTVIQLLKIHEEDPKDWLPNVPGWNDEPLPPPPEVKEQPKVNVSIKADATTPSGIEILQQTGVLPKDAEVATGGPIGPEPVSPTSPVGQQVDIGVNANSQQSQTGNTPVKAQTVVPPAQINSNPVQTPTDKTLFRQ